MSGGSKRFVAIAVFTALLIVLVNLAWWLSYRRTEALLEDQLSRKLRAVAETAAASIDPTLLDGLVLDDARSFLQVVSILEAVRGSDSLAEAFILDDRYRYLASTTLETDSLYFLTVLNGPYIDSVLFGEPSHALVSATYRSGAVYLKSAFAPLYDSDRLLVGVLGLEASVDYFDSLGELRRNLYYSTVLSLIGGIALGAVFLGLQRKINAAERKLFLSETETYLGRMVSVVAHEIKNPMMIIRGSAERIARKNPSEESQYIIEEVDRLNQIVSGYLEFAGNRTSILAAESPEAFDPAELVASLRSHVLQRYADTPIEWLGDIPAGVQLTGYRRSLRQVLLNLLINGVDACLDAGLPVSVGIDLSSDDRTMILRVVDRGPGIDRAGLKRLFDPFYTTKQTGSGLGLYISRRIITDMGGALDIESTVGSGSSVTIRLPKKPTT